MKAGILAVVAVGAGVAAALTLWPDSKPNEKSPAVEVHSNLGWNNAGSETAASLIGRTEELKSGEGGSDDKSVTVSDGEQPAAPQAINMQDGSVIYAAERTRTGAAPARER